MMSSLEAAPVHLPITLPFLTEPDSAKEHITSVLTQLKLIDAEGSQSLLKISRLTGGLTNVLFKVSLTNGLVLNIRLFGLNSHEVIDRDAEKENMIKLSRAGLGPPLYATFENGCIYGFVAGSIPRKTQLAEGVLDTVVAQELGRWHGSVVPGHTL